jgi:hypothetical protein
MYGKPSNSGNRQAKFEAFLDAQQAKQQARWFRDVPAILDGLTKVIQDLKFNLSEKPNFAAKSLPKLREYYKIAMDAQNGKRDYEAYRDSGEAIGNMVSQINSWFRTSRVAVGVKSYTDPAYTGKAQIAERFELVVGDNFDITVNRGWQ